MSLETTNCHQKAAQTPMREVFPLSRSGRDAAASDTAGLTQAGHAEAMSLHKPKAPLSSGRAVSREGCGLLPERLGDFPRGRNMRSLWLRSGPGISQKTGHAGLQTYNHSHD